MFTHSELVILTLALALCGQVHTGGIIGGHETKAHSRPYMVLLRGTTHGGQTRHCGGFLLNEDFVMTAAHCQAKSYIAFLGVHNVTDKTQTIIVEQAFPREDYNEIDFQNDIMLLKLSSKAQFDKKVQPIQLAGASDDPFPASCSVSGWGLTEKNELSCVLKEVNVTLIDNKQCAEHNLFCSKADNDGPGEGDSGGPLVCNGKAYGVVSLLLNDLSLYVYAKISEHKHWIDFTMQAARKNLSNI
ncbi:uncharacterized protein V6R79_019521 [Siganus canaliculatus]